MKQYIKYSYGDILYIRIAPYFLIFSLIMAYRSAETSPSDSQIFYVLLMFFRKWSVVFSYFHPWQLTPMCLPEQAISNCKGNAVFKFIIYIYSFVALLLYIVTATNRNLNLTAAFSFGFIYWNCRKWHFHDPTFKKFRGLGMPPHLP